MLYAIAFFANFFLLVLEIVAGRLIAPYLGVSVYTWTSVIGVILAGISVGSFLGGWLADRKHPGNMLSYALLAAGVSGIASIFFVQRVGAILEYSLVSLPLAALGVSFAAFFAPSLFLGMITPILVKLRLRTLKETGGVTGRLYAVGAAGSILGTFLAGFFLIAIFSTREIVVWSSLVLLGLGVYSLYRYGEKIRGRKHLLLILAALGAMLFLILAQPVPCLKESRYYCINLIPNEFDGFVTLRLDKLSHSFIQPTDPRNISGYGYEQVFNLIAEYSYQKYTPNLQILFLGGGGYVLPRFLQIERPTITMEVVEIDPEVTRVVKELVGNFDIPIIHEDARVYVNHLSQDKKYDLIVGDVFNDFSVPYQLTTKEFIEKLNAHLTQKGIYAINIVDSRSNRKFLSATVKTMSDIFPYVYVMVPESLWRTERPDIYFTAVIFGTKEPIDQELLYNLTSLMSERDRKLTWLLPKEDVEQLIDEGVVLTDNFAPVENMVSAVSSNRRRN